MFDQIIMCGISGIISLDNPEIDRAVLKRMNDAIAARGPDDEGFYFSARVGIGHRRLSIIDLVTGHQPMTTSDGRHTIVFNGELYNFLELRAQLKKAGVSFRTRSDTEVLLELFAREGEACLSKLNGMFAFAVWDAREKSLFAARDRAGKKPFYYARLADQFIFASELKALLKHPDIRRRMDAKSLAHFLTYEYVPAPLAMIENTHKLPAGHYLKFRDGRLEIQRYWQAPFGDKLDVDENTASRDILGLLDRAVEYRLISDVPLGVFLSGGIDSSAVVALMARHREGKNIKTFSIGFSEASYDESLYAETVAKRFGTDHHVQTLSATGMLDILPQVTDTLDEPFADGSILPTYLLSRFTREHVTVALGGDGGDELFAGYPTFFAGRVAGWYRKFPRALRALIRGLSNVLPISDKNMSLDFKLRQFLQGADHDGVLRNQMWLSAIPPGEQTALFTPEFARGIAAYDPFALITEEMRHCPSDHAGDRLLYFYQKFYLTDDILFKVDRASMAHSLEVRAPFLDVNVMEYAARLPYGFKLKGVTAKYILKKTLNRLLPAMITQRPKKGFGIPVSGWLKNELKPLLLSVLSDDRLKRDGIFARTAVSRLITEHLGNKRNHRKPLFALLMLHLWMDKYLRA